MDSVSRFNQTQQHVMITPKETLLLVIDVQGKLAPTVFQSDRLIKNVSKLIRACGLLGVPVIHTEQYPKGLGRTVDELAALIGDEPPYEKLSFSCCGNEDFMKRLRALGRNDILVVGMETHVCVYQTCVELLEFGYNVHLVTDAVSSRSEENRALGIRCIERAGASLTSTEMAIFEILRVAEGDTFKAISKIIKED
jgi:nicotinamidase-related amidase